MSRRLSLLGYELAAVADGEAAVERRLQAPPDVAILDLTMPGLDGIAAPGPIRSSDPEAVVVLMTAHGTVQTAVEAMQLGVAEFVTNPFTLKELELRLRRSLGLVAAARENEQLRGLLESPARRLGMVVQSPAMTALAQ